LERVRAVHKSEKSDKKGWWNN